MNTTFATLAIAGLMASAAVADPAGYSPLTFDAPHHGKGVVGAVWYPTGGPGREMPFADSPVFVGVTVVEEAPVAEGRHPVVLLSHGMGGNIRSLAWLASALAEQGAVVVSVNHPNSTWGDFDMAAGMRHWTRAQDLSLALDTLMADPRFEGHLDPTRIMAAGFSYGGWTALSLGGLRGNLAGYVDHCRVHGEASAICTEVLAPEVDLASFAAADWNGTYADPRVTHVVAIEPGLIWGLGPAEIAQLVPDVRLIGLGAGSDRMLATDFDTSGLAGLLPGAIVDRIAPAIHFTALPLCKPMAEAILIEEQDDPVCTDPAGTDRAAVHRQIVSDILSDLDLAAAP
jgi:predicted dienelactone hydrolase